MTPIEDALARAKDTIRRDPFWIMMAEDLVRMLVHVSQTRDDPAKRFPPLLACLGPETLPWLLDRPALLDELLEAATLEDDALYAIWKGHWRDLKPPLALNIIRGLHDASTQPPHDPEVNDATDA
jgi:hypothetical protein